LVLGFLAWNLGFFGAGEKTQPRKGEGAASKEPKARRGGASRPSPEAGEERGKTGKEKAGKKPLETAGRGLPSAGAGRGPREKAGPASRPARKKALSVLLQELAAKGVHLDLKRKLIWVDGETWIHNANLEYVATGRRGCTHETLLVLDCKASALNAALLALGLQPGKNYTLKPKVPPPPKKDVLAGKVKPFILVHPQGPGVYLTVEWKGAKGKSIRYRVEDLVLDLGTNKPLPRRKWIYFGGRWAPLYRGERPVYVADYEENLISVCYMDPGNHLITIKDENGLDQGRWWPNFYLLPPKGTPVKLYISLEPLPGTNPPPPPPKIPKKGKEKGKK